jgi:hypothetical protein
MTARELIEHSSPMVAKLFNETGRLLPMWHAVDENDKHYIFAAPFTDTHMKDIVAELIREQMRAIGATACLFVAESWALETMSKPSNNISSHPDREECLFFSAEDANGTVLAHQIIDSSTRQLQPLEFLDTKIIKGRFTGMLPIRGRKQ